MDNPSNNQSSQNDPLAFFKDTQEQQNQKAQPYLQDMSNIYNKRSEDIKSFKDKLNQNSSDYFKSINENLPAAPEYKNVKQSMGALGSLTVLLMALATHGNGGQSKALTFAQIYNGMNDSIKKDNIDAYKIQVEQYKNQVERLIAENNLKLNKYNEITKNLIAGNTLDAQDAAIGMQVDKAGIDNIKNENNTLYKIMTYVEKAKHDADALDATKNWRKTQVDMGNARNELSASEHNQTMALGEKRLKKDEEHNTQAKIDKLNSKSIELLKTLNNSPALPGMMDTANSDQIKNSINVINNEITKLGGTPVVHSMAASKPHGTPAPSDYKGLSPEIRNAIGSIKNKKKTNAPLTPEEQQTYDVLKQKGLIE